ncbi:DNA polymerase Y family protein [Nocardioidaceae bacterium SCSIO 66511]|nr:DNA polymerase Y family protein [Nocardioidaceae bacterium SCSIO 66511]
MSRSMIVWCPDWPVRAAMRASRLPVDAPVALLRGGQVYACSAAARSSGVRRGLRQRDAQSRCPELVVQHYDEATDIRSFEPAASAIEAISPGVHIVRPGTCALAARGVSSYYGGEPHAAAVIAERLVGLGIDDCRIGVADGAFTAEQAARRAGQQDSYVVAPGGSAAFLCELPIDVLGEPELVGLLRRLGLRTLGDLAVLPEKDVGTRFGRLGVLAHRLARGEDSQPVALRRPPPELECAVTFETPLERIDPVAFSVRTTAEQFVAGLARHGLVCTTVWVEVYGESGEVSERQWMHPRWFDAPDLVDRVRWQLQGGVGAGVPLGSELTSPVVRVRFVPDAVASLADHADGLWGSGPDERIHRAVSRVQSMLGHGGVVSAVVGGGRGPRERQTLVPWGDRLVAERDGSLPWPGSVPPPAPATVYPRPLPATVVGVDGKVIGVSGRGILTGEPTRFAAAGDSLLPVQAWAGPWPVDERWWDERSARRLARLQVVGVDGSAWLLACEEGSWWVEARYD